MRAPVFAYGGLLFKGILNYEYILPQGSQMGIPGVPKTAQNNPILYCVRVGAW
jgi:hypothetical protein